MTGTKPAVSAASWPIALLGLVVKLVVLALFLSLLGRRQPRVW